MKKLIAFGLPALLLAISLVLTACWSGVGGDEDKSSAKAITGFTLGGVDGAIDETNKTVALGPLPYGTNITGVTPTVSVSDGASYTPTGAVTFTSGVGKTYTVTAEDASTQDYTVTVTVAASDYSASSGIVADDLKTVITSKAASTGTGSTTGNPTIITIVGTGSGTAATDIGNLYTALANATGVNYVSLDLSGMTNITEWKYVNNATATAKIVSITLPNTVISLTSDVYGGAFQAQAGNFSNLKSVTGASVTTVGNSTFQGCTAITSLSLPEATDIGQGAFYSCTTLASLSLPEATSIGVQAFTNCTALTSLSLPEARTIDRYAFTLCTALASLDISSATTIGDGAFQTSKYADSTSSTCKVHLGGSISTWDDTYSAELSDHYNNVQVAAAGWYYRNGSATWNYSATDPTP